MRREAQVRAAEAKLNNARTEYNRFTQLAQAPCRRGMARVDVDRAETNYRLAQEEHQAALQMLEMGTTAREEKIDAQEAEVRGLEGRVVEAKLQLDDTSLRTPYDGVIAQRFVEQSQNVRGEGTGGSLSGCR